MAGWLCFGCLSWACGAVLPTSQGPQHPAQDMLIQPKTQKSSQEIFPAGHQPRLEI